MNVFNKYVGQVFDGRYKIERTVGEGGMAVVFEATDLLTNRKVAVKMLKDSVAGNTQAIKRFIIESKAVAMLNHENIVKVYDISVRGEHKYIVMELLKGITLRKYMENKGVLSWQETVAFSEQILSALSHAHMKGVIHRDIKPQNIMLLEGGFVKVTDFGIAKIPKAETLTMADKAIGTVFYLSPEQAQCKKIDLRSDLYSLGVMMYEMATGRMPFTADTPAVVIYQHITKAPVPPSQINPSIPIGLEQIILCAMEKNPDDRYHSAPQMLRHLSRLRQDPSVVFVRRRSVQKTPTAELAISKTARGGGSSAKPPVKEPKKPSPSKKKRPPSGGRAKVSPSSDDEGAGVPLWLAACIFIAFLALAVIGLIVIYNLLFSGKNVDFEFATKAEAAILQIKNFLSGGNPV